MPASVGDEGGPAAPARSAGTSPLRRPGSIRRTSTIDASWPEGLGEPVLFEGRARDLLTPASGNARVVAEDWMRIVASPTREILAIQTSRAGEQAQGLVGVRAGGHLRARLAELLPNEGEHATPLHLLIDDFCGASLVASWAWSRWDPDWMASKSRAGIAATAGKAGRMEGICAGFRPGSSALRPDGTADPYRQSSADVPSLPHPDDPNGWHHLPVQDGVGHRRARRTDVWIENEGLCIDAGFQDSGATPVLGRRQAVHEYRVVANASREGGVLRDIEAMAHILPYPECPAAAANVSRMVGHPLAEFRRRVVDELSGTAGCTHLNDVLRSLADVPALARAMDGISPAAG